MTKASFGLQKTQIPEFKAGFEILENHFFDADGRGASAEKDE
ncbi:MAG: hypothetical protein Q7U66_06360 [Methylobacter sp.]|nr:hypothetical protein [Methylobacter sp.]